MQLVQLLLFFLSLLQLTTSYLHFGLPRSFQRLSTSATHSKSTSNSLRKHKGSKCKCTHSRTPTSLPLLNSMVSGSEALATSFSDAFVGGTVGVMSVMFLVEVRKVQDKTMDESCPYCMGNGEILCGACVGSTKMAGGGTCSCCNGRGLIMCINCKGDGRLTPIILQSKAVRDPEFQPPNDLSVNSP